MTGLPLSRQRLEPGEGRAVPVGRPEKDRDDPAWPASWRSRARLISWSMQESEARKLALTRRRTHIGLFEVPVDPVSPRRRRRRRGGRAC